MSEAQVNRSIRSWGFVDAADPASQPELDRLAAQMSEFYANEAKRARYWDQAESGNTVWQLDTHPFHCHLASLITPDATVVDFGCGTAHAARNLKQGVRYIGVEGSEAQVELNRRTFPQHQFIQGNMLDDHGIAGQADWAVSFFAIEHCVRPDLLLQRMLATCKPGGQVAILCPNFSIGMNSIRSGWSALTKREKLRRLRLADLVASVIEEKWVWPTRVATIHRSGLEFPIYLKPRCLEAAYFSDNDAVYLASERKLTGFLRGLGCEIDPVTKSAPHPELHEAVIYVIARKP